MKLENKVALITGASKGIGREIALLFGKEGAKVIVHYNHSEREAEELLSQIESFGGKAFSLRGDLSYADLLPIIIKEAMSYGHLDILVNNAGVYDRTHFHDTSLDTWNRVLSINLTAPLLLSKFFISDLLNSQRKGKIINIASDAGLHLKKDIGIEYATTKAALIHLSKSLAETYGEKGISINCLAPHYTITDMTRRRFEEHPELDWQTPDQVAQAALYLATENLNGRVYVVKKGEMIE